jgi:hypothetical protein
MDPKVQRKLELSEAAARVPQDVRRHIINDHIGMWVAAFIVLAISKFVFGF